jgi:YrbI family 3-deoxy-D-manno-octulosonate 8-phosphate phosphatase
MLERHTRALLLTAGKAKVPAALKKELAEAKELLLAGDFALHNPELLNDIPSVGFYHTESFLSFPFKPGYFDFVALSGKPSIKNAEDEAAFVSLLSGLTSKWLLLTDYDKTAFKCCFKAERGQLLRKMDRREIIQAAKIKLIVYDFDGVMTNNRVILNETGVESVAANRSDGLAVGMIAELGIKQMILSTETNPVVKARAAKLKIEVIAACKDKKKALKDYCSQNGYDLKHVIFIGNDVNDTGALETAGLPICPADAHQDAAALAKVVMRADGGAGVVRELYDYLKPL